jgi:hypothetical protein
VGLSPPSTRNATVPAARLDAWGAVNGGAGALLVTRGARVVRVGNGLHPSAWRAGMLGVDPLELERLYQAGLLTDPVALAETGERLREVLRAVRRPCACSIRTARTSRSVSEPGGSS